MPRLRRCPPLPRRHSISGIASVLEANLTRAVIKNECAAPADIGSMVLSQAEHIVIGETPEGRYILGPGQSYEVPIEAHAGTLRLTGVGGYGEYAVCEVTA